MKRPAIVTELDVRNGVITFDSLPTWATSSDVMVSTGPRLYLRSLTQSEPRWRGYARRLARALINRLEPIAR